MTTETRDIQSLLKLDQQLKGADFDREVDVLWSLYRNTARDHMRKRLKELRLGIANDPNPPQVSVLRPIIDKLAVAYQAAPTRWLVGADGERLAEDDAKHEAQRRAYAASKMDLALRSMDQKRALAEQSVVRLYGTDRTQHVEPRVFLPCFVHREPDAAVGSSLDYDRRFALCIYAGNRSDKPEDKVYEYWDRTSTGAWRMAVVNGSGAVIDSPYGLDGVSFDELPAQIFYADAPDGAPWLMPQQSRITFAENVNALFAELVLLVKSQAHSQQVITGVDPNTVPKERGPDVTIAFSEPDANVIDTTPNPRIREALDVVQHAIRMGLVSEDLPTDLLNETQAVLTGAAARQKFRGLIERREKLAAMAGEDERQLWRRYVSVHNAYASSWGVESLPTDLDLEVELADLNLPDDASVVVEVASRDIALGLASRIDAVMRERKCNRAAAIRVVEQIDRDRKDYPTPIAPDAARAMEAGPRTASAPDAVLDANGEDSNESVLDAIGGTAQAGDAVTTPATAPAAAGVKVSDVTFNGSQITSAIDIIVKVAAKELPRSSGVAMLVSFLRLPPDEAESVMGEVGTSFFAEPPEPPAPAFGGPPRDAASDQE